MVMFMGKTTDTFGRSKFQLPQSRVKGGEVIRIYLIVHGNLIYFFDAHMKRRSLKG